jgi:hypothetical protein
MSSGLQVDFATSEIKRRFSPNIEEEKKLYEAIWSKNQDSEEEIIDSREEQAIERNSEGDEAKTFKVVAGRRKLAAEKKKVEVPEQTKQQTSATGSEKPEPRLMETLIANFKGMQHQLQTLTQSMKQLIREKKWARKAQKRRERRRAARQMEVEYQPLIPADSTPTPKPEGEDGIKTEAGTQPPTED